MAQRPDVKRLRLSPAAALRPPGRRNTSPRQPRVHGLFLKGPVSWTWLSTAARLPGRALHVALGIRLFTGIKKTRRIALSVSWLSQLGVSRHAAYRGLKALEDRGLVSVDRHRGRKPLVTVIEIESDGVTVSPLQEAGQESKHGRGSGRRV